jgi:hypothetical protein
MTHITNLIVVVLSILPLVSHIEFMLQSLNSFFAYNPKKLLEFIKLVKTLETKGLKLLRIMKTCWISMLSLLKHILAQYKSLVMKMHSDCEKKNLFMTTLNCCVI